MTPELLGTGALDGYKEGEFDKGLAVAGGVVGALMGALLWGLLGKALKAEFRYLAPVLGLLTGLGVLLMGRGRGNVPAILGGVLGLFSLILGKILIGLWVLRPMDVPMSILFGGVWNVILMVLTVSVGVFVPAGDNLRNKVLFFRKRVGV